MGPEVLKPPDFCGAIMGENRNVESNGRAMGRPRKPSEVLEASGSYDHDPQRRRHDEPPAASGEPAMPEYFAGVAEECWNTTTAIMRQMGTLSSGWQKILERYCLHTAMYHKCLDALDEGGLVIETKDGPKRSPWSIEMRQHASILAKCETELGVTPVSRSKVSKVTGTKSDDDKFFGGPRIAETG